MTKTTKDTKALQLGMHPSTANNKLVKDILFNFVVTSGNNICFHCGKELLREDFSIEHKVAWMHTDNPVELFFDIDNIAFSHLGCNIRAGRGRKLYGDAKVTSENNKRIYRKNYNKINYDPVKRRELYKTKGY